MSDDIDLFYLFWSGLDAMFSFIETSFSDIFNALPRTAISVVISIFAYSALAICVYIAKKQQRIPQKSILYLIYGFASVLTTLYSLWRAGIIAFLKDQFTAKIASAFFINLGYMVYAVVLIVSFKNELEQAKKWIIALLWVLLILLTFVICPILGESRATDDSVYQLLLIGAVCASPTYLVFKPKEAVIQAKVAIYGGAGNP